MSADSTWHLSQGSQRRHGRSGGHGGHVPIPSSEGECGVQMAGAGCIPALLERAACGRRGGGEGSKGGAAAAAAAAAGLDDLVGATILSFLTVADATRAAQSCKAARDAGPLDFRRLAGVRFRHVDLLLQKLPAFRSLVDLDLGSHDLGPAGAGAGAGCRQLAAALVALATDERAGGLSATETTTATATTTALKPRLRRLELAACRVGAEGCLHLVRALEAGAGRSLQSLDLSANLLWDQAPLALARVLGSGAACPHLLDLDLSRNFIGAEGAREIAQALRAGGCRELTRLDISGNELSAAGLRELLGAFVAGACPRLEELAVGSNNLGVEGAIELGRSLQHGGFGPKLKRLSLASNSLGSVGVQVLMDAIAAAAAAASRRHGGFLAQARPFRYYHINPALLAQQREAASSNAAGSSTTREAGHRRCGFRGGGGDSKPPPSPLAALESLDLFLNEMQDSGARGLAGALAQRLLPNLKQLDVRANRLGPAGIVGIVSALEAAAASAPAFPAPPRFASSASGSGGSSSSGPSLGSPSSSSSSPPPPRVDMSLNLLPQERGAVSDAAVPQGVLL